MAPRKARKVIEILAESSSEVEEGEEEEEEKVEDEEEDEQEMKKKRKRKPKQKDDFDSMADNNCSIQVLSPALKIGSGIYVSSITSGSSILCIYRSMYIHIYDMHTIS
jgi:hypothetical protein